MPEQRYTANFSSGLARGINLAANTSSNPSWTDLPPAPKPEAQKVRYLGQGTGAAAGVNLCVMAHDLRIRTRNAVDGRCSREGALMPTDLRNRPGMGPLRGNMQHSLAYGSGARRSTRRSNVPP